MEKNYVAPAIDRTAFHCPHCGTKAPQRWLDCHARETDNPVPLLWNLKSVVELIESGTNNKLPPETIERWRREAAQAEVGDFNLTANSQGKYCGYSLSNVYFSVCQEVGCNKAALWIHDKLVIPSSNIEESPNEDMPDKIKVIYNEARDVYAASPRASAALLRLCCEMLCQHLKAEGNSFNEQIGFLVGKGMDEGIQKALDVLRFIGNDAVHPGQIDLKDDVSTSHALFVLVNEIVQEMISKPKRLNNLYSEKLPESVRLAIEKRNTKAKTA